MKKVTGFAATTLILVMGAGALMLLAHHLGFYSVEVPGIKIRGAPQEVTKDPTKTLISGVPQSYQAERRLENASGLDWVEAKCPMPQEHAISGLCVINSEDGWGWLLQNAGVTGSQTWGCAYRRSVYVEGGTANDGRDHGKFFVGRSSMPLAYDVRGAAVSATATATVLCVDPNK